ncbi:MAG: hypothetical protein WBS24_07080 [Terriglobales bacterium]
MLVPLPPVLLQQPVSCSNVLRLLFKGDFGCYTSFPRQFMITSEVQKLRIKGNSNWGKPCGEIPNMPTSFEEMVRQLELSEEEYVSSIPLKEWAKMHKDSKYVPQDLLKAWGIIAKG